MFKKVYFIFLIVIENKVESSYNLSEKQSIVYEVQKMVTHLK